MKNCERLANLALAEQLHEDNKAVAPEVATSSTIASSSDSTGIFYLASLITKTSVLPKW
ncbi:hypothetical protein E1A91_D08G147900v1 [Gossypium mustelinum]|uniref:Uncharacterized protein n=1 Tax=Gossypium mustelinum TaxID=34275 RepID=A0A5D2TW84_GOSMU|nr:hypothetical protein E1A91_D08G147900v1 [Gossypium mustelinum]